MMKSKDLQKDYKRVCKEKDEQMINEHGYLFCELCGITSNLSHAHIIPRRFKAFYCIPENLPMMCMSFGGRDGCHNMLDDSVFEKLQARDMETNNNLNFTNSLLMYLIDNGFKNRAYKLSGQHDLFE